MMRQDPLANIVTCAGIPMMAFGLTTILPSGIAGWPLGVVLFAWTMCALLLCLVPSLRRYQESLDLVGALALATLTGGVTSPFASLLPVVIVITGARLGTRTGLLQATVASLVLAVASFLGTTGALGLGDSGAPLVAMSLALHGVAVLSGRLKGRWTALEEQHDLIVHSLEEGIIVTDDQGRVVRANPSARRALGFPDGDDWRGRLLSELLRRTTDEKFLDALTSPRKRPQAIDWTPREGEQHSFLVRTTEVEEGLLVSVFTDRTSERRVVEAEARLLHLEELEELSLGLAHQIRNPLASLRGAAVELVSGKLPAQQASQMEEIIRRESERLDRTVNGFLEYSRCRRLESPRPIEVGLLIDDVINSIRQRQDALDIEITRKVDDSLQILCVQDELYEVVNNLAINAVEACSGGGHIHFQLTTKQDDCVLEVCDDGVGMSPDVQARAFHPFFSTKPREGGLGLAMVRKTVVSSGGWIELESQPGAGTTFRIGMPLAPQMKRATTKAVI